jgi:lysophospholipid acyltransferase (LPLAT)-like uncharacterized protein
MMAAGRLETALGILMSSYLRLVWKTSRFVVEPPDAYERGKPDLPVIIAMWHGQFLMMPFLRGHHRVKVLISRHRDADAIAIAAERLGIDTIRGSGDHNREFFRKRGVTAFWEMAAALKDQWTVALTADVPKVWRVASPGIVLLARESGRAIYPIAVATSRRLEIKSWDRMVINLPFSRMAIVVGEPIRVHSGGDAVALEAARLAVQASLNAATERAYGIVDHWRPGARGD